MDQTSSMMPIKTLKQDKNRSRENKNRSLKRKMNINQTHSDGRDKKKYKIKDEDQTKKDYGIPRRDSYLPEQDLQPGPSKPREYNSTRNNQWPQDYQNNPWSRGRREYRGYTGNYGDHRGQS